MKGKNNEDKKDDLEIPFITNDQIEEYRFILKTQFYLNILSLLLIVTGYFLISLVSIKLLIGILLIFWSRIFYKKHL